MPQIALVTGTSSGMGLHTAVGLAGRGITVVATLRDPTTADALHAWRRPRSWSEPAAWPYV